MIKYILEPYKKEHENFIKQQMKKNSRFFIGFFSGLPSWDYNKDINILCKAFYGTEFILTIKKEGCKPYSIRYKA